MSEIENSLFIEGMVEEKTVEDESWLESAMTAHAMASEFSTSRPRVEKYIEKLVDANPDLDGKYAVKNGKRGFYFPKKLVDIVKRISEGEEGDMPPEGWLTLNEIVSILPRSKKWIESRVLSLNDKYYKSNTNEYLIKGVKRFHLHYSPDLIEKLKELIKEEDEKYVKPEEGEMTERGIGAELGRSKKWVKKNIDKLVQENPEWGGTVGKEDGRAARDYYPKELVDKLREISSKEEFLPPGRPRKIRPT